MGSRGSEGLGPTLNNEAGRSERRAGALPAPPVESCPLAMSNGMRKALLLIVALALVTGLASGPAVVAADAKPKCRSGYKAQRKRGVWRCVRRPKRPKPPKDAVYPSSIELLVGKVRSGRFGATGYMRFPERVTGTAYGQWVLSNGQVRQRLPFKLRSITDTDYTPFTIGYPIKVWITGRTLTATLVIGRTRSNTITLQQD